MFEVTTAWKSAFPGARAGVLVMREVSNPALHPELEKRKGEIEAALRSQFSGQDRAAIASNHILQAYNNHYRRFKKSYHVQLQLESIVLKGKSIPSVSALVEAMFMAEMKNLLLTAGHDLDIVQLPLILDVSRGAESYTLMRGSEQLLKPGDMMISDQAGVISDVIYGPDRRTQITGDTRNAVFTTYAPEGIEELAVERHLQDIRDFILIFAPQAEVELLKVFS
jgi:DNA/RNA-binding domain of Phe-tRNA-synthetase-like protein